VNLDVPGRQSAIPREAARLNGEAVETDSRFAAILRLDFVRRRVTVQGAGTV